MTAISGALSLAPVSLWAVSAYELTDLVRRCAPDYAGQARVSLIESHFEQAVDLIGERLRHERCDVLLSAGANADYLRTALDIPVVALRVGGHDVMAALAKAHDISKRIALVFYRQVPQEVSAFVQGFGMGLELCAYASESEARHVIARLKGAGIPVVIGGGLVTSLARQSGLTGIFLYSRHSVEVALEEAIRLATAQQAEKARRRTLSSVLEHLHEGVIATDVRGDIVAANRAARALTGAALTEGGRLALGLPEIQAERSQVLAFKGEQVVVERSTLREGESISGALYTLHPSTEVRQAFHKLRRHEQRLSARSTYTLDRVVQQSAEMQAVVRRSRTYAAHGEATILISGPSGVGKELLAQGIHNASPRRRQAFVAVNCGALTESLLESELFGYEEGAFTGARRSGKPGLIEVAHQGTLFLDEIAELPHTMQTRFLRVLQEREVTRVGGVTAKAVDFRVIAATHCDLAQMVRAGQFREDLYYRIAVLRLDVPPLWTRPDDILALARDFVARALHAAGMADCVTAVLHALPDGLAGHSWPGNGRELENVAQRIAMACVENGGPLDAAQIRSLVDPVDPSHEVNDAGRAGSLSAVRQAIERDHAHAVLRACGGDHRAAARELGISRSTLWRKLRG